VKRRMTFYRKAARFIGRFPLRQTFGIASVSGAVEWLRGQRIGSYVSDLRFEVRQIGMDLRDNDYKGKDVSLAAPTELIDTVLAACMEGWAHMAATTSDEVFRREEQACLRLLLSRQGEDGVWRFPYAFRDNPSGEAYACENLMIVRALLKYVDRHGGSPEVESAVDKALRFVFERIGIEGGHVQYSPHDRVSVPNVTSMAANCCALAGRLLCQAERRRLASDLAEACISEQTDDGAYPYYARGDFVYVPYHALEMAELAEANRELGQKGLDESLVRAAEFLDQHLAMNGYVSHSPARRLDTLEFKTPIWSSRAYHALGNHRAAVEHLRKGLDMFRSPRGGYFYFVFALRTAGRCLRYPVIESEFIRYVASAFEIAGSVLREDGG